MQNYETWYIGASTPDLHARLRVALVNIPVYERQIEASYRGTPDLSRKRYDGLIHVLNAMSKTWFSRKKKIDLVVFPEVCIPRAWEKMIVGWARKHRTGVICGLEHLVTPQDEARNEVLAALPFVDSNGYKACIPIHRLKRWYSPQESFLLESEGLKIPSQGTGLYQLIHWRGVTFAIYNCYELASIRDRGLFMGQVDLIVVTEFNRDTNYFSNIVESASRDLHCYVIQVNDSRFGDSRVTKPTKTEKMNPLRIKGGDNITFLTMELDLASLREHQRRGIYRQMKTEEFKPTPPGFDKSEVIRRIKMGKK